MGLDYPYLGSGMVPLDVKLLTLSSLLPFLAACGGGPRSDATGAPRDAGLASSGDGSSYAYYYANPLNYGAVYAVPTGAPSSVLLTAGSAPHGIGLPFAFDGHHVYYGDAILAGLGRQTSLVALSVSGGHSVTLASDLHAVSAIAVDSTNLYFLDVDPTLGDGSTPQAAVGKVSLGGGAVETLANPTSSPTSICVDPSYVYWTEVAGSVLRVPIAGGAVETLAQGQVSPGGITVDSTGIYWFNTGHSGRDCIATDGTVMVLPPGNSAPVPMASNIVGVSSLAVSAGKVYWTASGPGCNGNGVDAGTLSRLALPQTAAQTLVTGVTGPGNLFVDATTVYFTVFTDAFNGLMAPSAVSN